MISLRHMNSTYPHGTLSLPPSSLFYHLPSLLPPPPPFPPPCYVGLQRLLGHVPDQSLPDLLSSIVKGSFEEKLKVLDAVQLVQKLKAAQPLVTRQIEVGTVCIFHSDHSLSVHGKGLCVVCWSCDVT